MLSIKQQSKKNVRQLMIPTSKNILLLHVFASTVFCKKDHNFTLFNFYWYGKKDP